MIGKLTGKIDAIHKNTIILDVSNVGYKVTVPTSTLSKHAKLGQQISLFIHTYVREDILALYGFETLKELSLFEKLLSISGIGGETALSVISSGTIEEITKAVINADIDFFIAIPGIGQKSAQRLIVDLKAAIGDETEFDLTETETPAYKETIDALKQFGFKASEARSALKEIKNKNKLTTEELLKETLKLLGK